MSTQDAFDRILTSFHAAMLDDTLWPATSALIDDACRMQSNGLLVGEGPPDDTLSATVTDTRYNTRNGTEASRRPLPAANTTWTSRTALGRESDGQRPDSNRRHLGHQERGGQRVDRYDRLE